MPMKLKLLGTKDDEIILKYFYPWRAQERGRKNYQKQITDGTYANGYLQRELQ